MLQLIGQCGPLVGTRLYPEEHAPLYTSGMCACAASMVCVSILALTLRWYLGRENTLSKKGYGKIGEEGKTPVLKNHREATQFMYML